MRGPVKSIALRVTDTGTGMNAETPGLVVVQQVIADTGGAIYVKSQPGKGATFTIHLPWERAAAGMQAIPRRERGSGQDGFRVITF